MSNLHFYPERVGWIGMAVLMGTLLLTLPFFPFSSVSIMKPRELKSENKLSRPLDISLGLNHYGPTLSAPNLGAELTFSCDPLRPGEVGIEKPLFVRLKKSAESKRIILPCTVYLETQKGKVVFAKEASSFWIELSQKVDGQIEGKGYITSLEQTKVDAGTFSFPLQDCPIQVASDFAEKSPFRQLAEGHWWGRDLLREHTEPKGGCEKLEVSSQFLELGAEEWLVWKEGRWQKSSVPEKEIPIVRLESNSGKALILEGWDQAGHVRLAMNSAISAPFKIRGEDFLTSVRIRSEKQISCMIEKQCMVLKAGDWVLKSGGRWKKLKKEIDREAFLDGKLCGELFIFEQICQKQGQKMIQGRFFPQARTQVANIEMIVQMGRKEKNMRKGKMQ